MESLGQLVKNFIYPIRIKNLKSVIINTNQEREKFLTIVQRTTFSVLHDQTQLKEKCPLQYYQRWD